MCSCRRPGFTALITCRVSCWQAGLAAGLDGRASRAARPMPCASCGREKNQDERDVYGKRLLLRQTERQRWTTDFRAGLYCREMAAGSGGRNGKRGGRAGFLSLVSWLETTPLAQAVRCDGGAVVKRSRSCNKYHMNECRFAAGAEILSKPVSLCRSAFCAVAASGTKTLGRCRGGYGDAQCCFG